MGERGEAAFPGLPGAQWDIEIASGLGLGEAVFGAVSFEELGEGSVHLVDITFDVSDMKEAFWGYAMWI